MSNEAQKHYADGAGPAECLEVNAERDALRAESADRLRTIKEQARRSIEVKRERADLRARNKELVAALEAHEEADGEPFHDDPLEDCDFDRQGGQRDCPKCVANAMTRAALSKGGGR